jgi:hypothetical protein
LGGEGFGRRRLRIERVAVGFAWRFGRLRWPLPEPLPPPPLAFRGGHCLRTGSSLWREIIGRAVVQIGNSRIEFLMVCIRASFWPSVDR